MHSVSTIQVLYPRAFLSSRGFRFSPRAFPVSLLLRFLLAWLVAIYTSIKIIKNEVGCRDDTVPKTVGTRRHCEEE